MTPLPSGSLAQIWPQLLRGKFITNQWLPCCLRSSIHRHFLDICGSSVHCRKFRMYWIGPLLLGWCLWRIWAGTGSTIASFWKWSAWFEGWGGRRVKLVFAAWFGDYLYRKGEFKAPKSMPHIRHCIHLRKNTCGFWWSKGRLCQPHLFSHQSLSSLAEWLLPDYAVPYHGGKIGFIAGVHLQQCHSLGSTGQLA